MDPLRAIAEPRRQAILRLVRDRELSVGDIAARFDVTAPAISQHLKVLRECGLLAERRDGTRRFYRARPDGLSALVEFIEDFWDVRLPAVKADVEAPARRPGHD